MSMRKGVQTVCFTTASGVDYTNEPDVEDEMLRKHRVCSRETVCRVQQTRQFSQSEVVVVG